MRFYLAMMLRCVPLYALGRSFHRCTYVVFPWLIIYGFYVTINKVGNKSNCI